MLMKAIEKNAPQLEVLKLNANEIGPKAAELVVKTCYILLFFISYNLFLLYHKDGVENARIKRLFVVGFCVFGERFIEFYVEIIVSLVI